MATIKDVAALAAALRKVMLSPQAANEMGMRGRQRVENLFSVEREEEGITAVYNAVWSQQITDKSWNN